IGFAMSDCPPGCQAPSRAPRNPVVTQARDRHGELSIPFEIVDDAHAITRPACETAHGQLLLTPVGPSVVPLPVRRLLCGSGILVTYRANGNSYSRRAFPRCPPP